MIDIHSHILPYVDDGARDLDISIEMLWQAKEANTSAIVLTPHSNLYEYDKNLKQELQQVFDAFKNKVQNEQIDIKLYLGGEVFCDENVTSLAYKRLLPTINNSRFMLIEFDFYASSQYICDTIKSLGAMGYVPIVAHPERYECVKRQHRIGLDFMNSGALLQVNKGSLIGDFGERERDCAFELINHRLAQFVASDAHTPYGRNPDMEYTYDIVQDDFGDKMAHKLFKSNPLAVINNDKLTISKPIL